MKKHIFIGGTSFCGSTMISLILGSADGVGNISESNWLVPRLGENTKQDEIWSNYNDLPQCRLCGSDCPLWTESFRRELQADRKDWHARIAERFGVDTLVSAEKGLSTIRMLDESLDHTGLILFKPPMDFWQSIKKRPYKKMSIERALRWWANTYKNYLKDSYVPLGGKVFVNIQEFLDSPGMNVSLLLGRLGLSGDKSVLEYWRKPQHYLGGNFNVYDKLKTSGIDAVKVRPMPPSKANPEELVIANKIGVFEIFQELEERGLTFNRFAA